VCVFLCFCVSVFMWKGEPSVAKAEARILVRAEERADATVSDESMIIELKFVAAGCYHGAVRRSKENG
jgi:hypothetical protein